MNKSSLLHVDKLGGNAAYDQSVSRVSVVCGCLGGKRGVVRLTEKVFWCCRGLFVAGLRSKLERHPSQQHGLM